MSEQKESLNSHQARQRRASEKVIDQEKVVRRLNGSAKDHPEEQLLLNETRHNKASIDLNRAIFDYNEEKED